MLYHRIVKDAREFFEAARHWEPAPWEDRWELLPLCVLWFIGWVVTVIAALVELLPYVLSVVLSAFIVYKLFIYTPALI